ncbi:hypothetical protein RM780_18995 [Streptomyces sp. DSM 44917]|uniref:Uncharacterized protein n=1 Tax=Streptomyces boetiae TaxID=3075541 RepID=A0ABU2LBS4_9ACTN|nr:hypothetical protein [Streptomyces sp. DSM 44917]MDT0309031.1 hypothetical protein [Streptomyces sp. DSM 44917]
MSERTAAGPHAATLVAAPPRKVPVGAASAGVHASCDAHTQGVDPAAPGDAPPAGPA